MPPAIWTPCWIVAHTGESLVEAKVSRTEFFHTVRKPNQTKGGERWSRWRFDQEWADTPEGAIEKFVARQRVIAGKAKTELELAELKVRRGEQLRAMVAAHNKAVS